MVFLQNLLLPPIILNNFIHNLMTTMTFRLTKDDIMAEIDGFFGPEIDRCDWEKPRWKGNGREESLIARTKLL